MDDLTIDKHIGNKIRERRKQVKLGQAQLAELLNISPQQVQKYESGSCKLTINRLLQLSNVLNLKPDYFYEGVKAEIGDQHQSDIIKKERTRPLQLLLVETSSNDEAIFRNALEVTQEAVDLMVIREPESVMDFLQNHREKFSRQRPELIMMDSMPRADGLSLLKQIKKSPSLMDIPVVIFTNSVRVQEMREAYRLNAGGFIRKTQDFEEYCTQVHNVVRYWAKTVALPAM